MTAPHLKLSVNAADAISRTMYEQEETIRRLATENARLKLHIEMLDKANELMGQERDKAVRKAEACQIAAHAATQKLMRYHQEHPDVQFSERSEAPKRDSYDGDSLADQIEAHRGRS